MGDARKPQKSEDVALVYAPTEDGNGARILRAREGRLEAGEVRPMTEGQSLLGREVVKLKPRSGAPEVCDVEVLVPRETEQAEESGRPAVVATRNYRENWERIFGKRSEPPEPLN